MTPEERAFAAADTGPVATGSSTRRLSPWRVIGLFVAVLAATTAVVAFRTGSHSAPAALVRSSFVPYVDVTATPQYPFEDASTSVSANIALGFVVSSHTDACTPSWGAAYSLDQAATSMDLDRRIVRLRQRGGQVMISFGGVANSELAVGCTDVSQLAAAYRTVVRRYQIDSIDLDIEGVAASAHDVSVRRAQAIRRLQQSEQRAGRDLSVWLTLPVDPSGLTAQGRGIVADMLAADVRLAGVNALTMDYGQSLPAGTSLLRADEAALTHLVGQLRAAYAAAGRSVSAAAAWQQVGATPMIGQNDIAAERFEVGDARGLLAFARSHHLRRLSMWSVNRDQACGPNYADVTIVSVNCSGVNQTAGQFAKIFSTFSSRGTSSGGAASAHSPSANPLPTPTSTSIVDNPATSPYPIWNPELSYPAGTKIVWHRNVYQAKWWTQGNTPDAPVANAYDTPWTLIGPVLPGEHPRPTPTMKAGTYPDWSPTAVYRAGARVLYQGVGYQAKWYTSGDVPGVVVSDPGRTPWQLITTG